MSFIKRSKDQLAKILNGKDVVPQGLVEINRYFRLYGPIQFEFKQSGGAIVAVSKNFQYGSIVTSGKDPKELDKNIKDAILTSFEVPSAYAVEANIQRENEKKSHSYALA